MSTRQDVPSDGWHVEVDNANGVTFTPDTLDDPQRKPKANGYPTIEIPVRRSEKWMDSTFDEAPMRVWEDGKRQPIDALDTVELSGKKAVLHGRGGDELKQPVQAEYSQKPAHEAAQQLIQDNTSYTANVDTPATTREDGVHTISASTNEDWQNLFSFSETEPFGIYGDFISIEPTCVPLDAIDGNVGQFGPTVVNDSKYSGGQALHFSSSGDAVVFDFVFHYDIPAEYVGIKVRDEINGAGDISYKWQKVEFQNNTGTSKGLAWQDIAQDSFYEPNHTYENQIGTDITAEEHHFLRIEANGASDYLLDSIAVYDTRWNYTWPATPSSGGYLPGPERYPDKAVFTSDEVPQPRTIVGTEVDATFNSTETVSGGSLRVGWSHTQGEFYRVGQQGDTTASDHSLTNPGPSYKLYTAISRRGDDPSRQSIPTKGYNTHELHSFDIYADFSDLPLAVNTQLNSSLLNALKQLANIGNSVFEYARDPNDGSQSIEWAQMGQRESGVTLSPSDYSLTKDTSQVIQSASVYGSSVSHRTSFQANVGTAVALPNTKIQESSVTVQNPRTGERFLVNDDYTMSYAAGTITATSDGSLVDGKRYEVEYQYQTYAEYTLDGVTNPTTLPPRDIPGLTSNSACSQAVRTLVNKAKDPRFDATINLPNDKLGWSLVESLDVNGLPTNGQTLHLREITHGPSQTQLTLGIGQSVSDIVQDISDRVSNVSRHS